MLISAWLPYPAEHRSYSLPQLYNFAVFFITVRAIRQFLSIAMWATNYLCYHSHQMNCGHAADGYLGLASDTNLHHCYQDLASVMPIWIVKGLKYHVLFSHHRPVFTLTDKRLRKFHSNSNIAIIIVVILKILFNYLIATDWWIQLHTRALAIGSRLNC